MTLSDLGVLYAVAGVVSGALVQRRARYTGRRALLNLALAIALWPLWLPVALASADSRPVSGTSAGAGAGTDTERALLAAHESVRDGPLEGLLPRDALTRIVGELRRASERHGELDALLARPDFDLEAAENRVQQLERERASPRTLSSARLHLANVRRLSALRARDQRALDELLELSRALGTQLALAKFSGSSANDAGDIVSEVWARVEVLGSALEPTRADDESELAFEPHERREAYSGR
ncbi:MAG TPA: hypothetical protein VG937_05305 [Polyangiaceae bacterium]|nr:hypothetical protein [Polyangiaceae bacterium]